MDARAPAQSKPLPAGLPGESFYPARHLPLVFTLLPLLKHWSPLSRKRDNTSVTSVEPVLCRLKKTVPLRMSRRRNFSSVCAVQSTWSRRRRLLQADGGSRMRRVWRSRAKKMLSHQRPLRLSHLNQRNGLIPMMWRDHLTYVRYSREYHQAPRAL